ncbi:hypothetical protein [Wenyingzhuangia aestuarii]|uniref:hypothetical protein n=1 Tax=Wenyingzhuangia aestuarii TaxID=1647582 RepID=UPI00143A16DE|nr:hypothetical protein [Wenyingzhuangia aestuarii]NJB81383.1 hypothetical protein [Wenyingzhuangia aestuarii]
MKTTIRIVLLAIIFVQFGYAQDEFESSFDKENTLSANFGATTIGDQTFVGFRVQPEFSIGKFGLGLDVPLLFNTENGELRTQEFNNGVGVLRMVRYLRYGRKKKDAVYAKLGDMTGEQLGFGALLGNYSNAISFERRKVGISADLLFKKTIGLEAIYSDVNFDGTQKLLALRPYYKPLAKTSIPILKTLELGVSYVSDKDNFEETTEAGVTSNTTFTRDGNSAVGVDIGMTLLKNVLLKLTWDAQYAKLNKNEALAEDVNMNPGNYLNGNTYDDGSGFATGLEAQFRFVANVFHLNARIERQWYGENYIPQFFNFAYEINKDARLTELVGAEKSQGIYGRLGSEILGLVKIEGELILPDDLEKSNRGAIVGLNLQTKEIANFRARGKYVKGQLSDLGDAFKFDSKSLANILVTYRINKFLEAGVDYQWTYAEKEDGTFGTVNQVRPYVGVNIKL